MLPNAEFMIFEDYQDCIKCENLSKSRTQIVWGQGVPNAHLMFVGQGPGVNEDREGKPFIGASGQKLWEMICSAEIPSSWIYFTNAVLCRPIQPHPTTAGLFQDRSPTTQEIKNCRPRLLREIYEVDPFLIVALGKPALHALSGKESQLTAWLGKVFDVLVPSPSGTLLRYPVAVAFHPAYLLRDGTAEDTDRTIQTLNFVRSLVEKALF